MYNKRLPIHYFYSSHCTAGPAYLIDQNFYLKVGCFIISKNDPADPPAAGFYRNNNNKIIIMFITIIIIIIIIVVIIIGTLNPR